jgi:hypothetical protein
VTLHRALGRALGDPNVEMDPVLEAKMAEDDWLSDTDSASGNSRTMNENQFICAIFQLCDLWTDSSNVEEYISFLEFIFVKLCTTHLYFVTSCYELLRVVTSCYDLLRVVTTCYDLLRLVTN